jgi:DNA-binding transcriptional LysR family regulator
VTAVLRSYTPVRDPEVSELRAFCAAATLGSIAEAARAMNVSQPAMSKRLKNLEAVVGTELFVRSTRGVRLTAAGTQLYAVARRLLLSADTVHELITSSHTAVPVRLGASPTSTESRLPPVLSELARGETPIVVELITANSSVIRELVVEGRCDIGIVALDPHAPATDGLEERMLWRDEVVVLVPPGHQWQELREIPLAEFATTPIVERDPWSNASRLVAAALEQTGVHRRPPAAAIGSTIGVIETAMETSTPALISRDSARSVGERGQVLRRVEGMRFRREVALVWPGHLLDLPPTVQSVVQKLIELPFLTAADAIV